MKVETLQVGCMTNEYAHLISQWKYDGIYSMYSNTDDTADAFMNGDHFVCTDGLNNLVGYYCFGEDAQIPTYENNVYDDEFIDIGLGMNPHLCGNGLWLMFLKAGIEYACDFYKTTKFRLSVISFNERAIKVYKRYGFYPEREVRHLRSGEKFYVMKCI